MIGISRWSSNMSPKESCYQLGKTDHTSAPIASAYAAQQNNKSTTPPTIQTPSQKPFRNCPLVKTPTIMLASNKLAHPTETLETPEKQTNIYSGNTIITKKTIKTFSPNPQRLGFIRPCHGRLWGCLAGDFTAGTLAFAAS